MEGRLLPPNAVGLENVVSKLSTRISKLQVPTRDILNSSKCPQSLLGWLAWGLNVDIWDSSWDEATKRTAIANSIVIHKKKGTKYGLLQAVRSLGYTVEIEEWWEYEGPAHEFKLIIDLSKIDKELDMKSFRSLIKVIEDTKRYSQRCKLYFKQDEKLSTGLDLGSISYVMSNFELRGSRNDFLLEQINSKLEQETQEFMKGAKR